MNYGNIISAVFGTILKVIVTIGIVFFVYKGAMMCYDYGYRIFMEPAVSTGEGRTITVEITEDMTGEEMGKLLASKGLIRDAKLFELQYLLSEFREDMKPGTYDLSTAMTAEEMMEVIASDVVEEE